MFQIMFSFFFKKKKLNSVCELTQTSPHWVGVARYIPYCSLGGRREGGSEFPYGASSGGMSTSSSSCDPELGRIDDWSGMDTLAWCSHDTLVWCSCDTLAWRSCGDLDTSGCCFNHTWRISSPVMVLRRRETLLWRPTSSIWVCTGGRRG